MRFLLDAPFLTVATAALTAAPLLNDVAYTTVSCPGTSSGTRAVGEDIFGAMEAGFTATQLTSMWGSGCGTATLDGGIDTGTSESIALRACIGETATSTSSILDSCGGHTTEYHFHQELSCCTNTSSSTGHSGQVGKGLDGRYLYGKYESTGVLANLDACGGHWGTTPDGYMYHYHVQTKAPFTIGCYGPNADNSVVTLAQCRALYTGCSSTAKTYNVQVGTTWPKTSSGTVSYRLWCPCYDADGSTVGTSQLPCEANPSATGCTKTATETGVTATGYTAPTTSSGGGSSSSTTSTSTSTSGSGSATSSGSMIGSMSGSMTSKPSLKPSLASGSGSGMKRGVDDGSTTTTAAVQTGGAGTLVPTMLALSVAAAAMVLSK